MVENSNYFVHTVCTKNCYKLSVACRGFEGEWSASENSYTPPDFWHPSNLKLKVWYFSVKFVEIRGIKGICLVCKACGLEYSQLGLIYWRSIPDCTPDYCVYTTTTRIRAAAPASTTLNSHADKLFSKLCYYPVEHFFKNLI